MILGRKYRRQVAVTAHHRRSRLGRPLDPIRARLLTTQTVHNRTFRPRCHRPQRQLPLQQRLQRRP